MSDEFRPSSVFFAAANAAEKELPPASKALIERHDELHRVFMRQYKVGDEVPVELKDASEAICRDELANFAMECRCKGNDAAYREWKEQKAKGGAS